MGTSQVFTQEGVPGGTFLVKKRWPSGPSGYRRKESGRSWSWASSGPATVVQ